MMPYTAIELQGEQQQHADRRVGQLHERVVAEQVTRAVVAVGEVAAERDDRPHQERRHEREVRGEPEDEAVGPLGQEVFLEEQLDAVGQRLQDAERARPCSARCGSACRR